MHFNMLLCSKSELIKTYLSYINHFVVKLDEIINIVTVLCVLKSSIKSPA